MSGEKKSKGKFRVDKQKKSARPSPEQMKQLYMASEYVEWTPFAKSMGWDPHSSRDGLPITDWKKTKRDVIALEQAENLADAVFGHKSHWHNDVLKTLKDYPEANDMVLGLLKMKMNHYVRLANKDKELQIEAAKKGESYEPQFGKKVKTNELTSLAVAVKTVTESKHKSLMLNDWSFKLAEQFTDPKQFEKGEGKLNHANWKTVVIGYEDGMTDKQLQDEMRKWYDKPPLPHPPEEDQILDAEVDDDDDG